jgi:N-acetylmuramoyl-L-alanine amidase
MFFKQGRITNRKKQILQSVFKDNLRIAGISIEDPPPGHNRSRLPYYIRWFGIIALVALICIFPDFSLDKELAQIVTVSASEKLTDSAVQVLKNEIPMLMEPYESYWPEPRGHSSALDFYTNRNHHSDDYRMLISRQDTVRLSSLFGLDVKTIVIDPGHGGKDPGAIGIRGTQEKDITLDVSRRLKQRLIAKGPYKVLLTRDSDQTVSLAQRVEFAKDSKADLFISVHVNSLPNRSVNVIETFYFGPPLTSEILQLAEQENKGSHFTIGELNKIVQDIGNTLKRQESAMLAAAIQESLFLNIRKHDEQVLDVGIKMAPFVVLSGTDVPSVLVEISCLTKEEEEIKLTSAEYREKIASYIEDGIIRYMQKQHSPITAKGEIQ